MGQIRITVQFWLGNLEEIDCLVSVVTYGRVGLFQVNISWRCEVESECLEQVPLEKL